MRSNLRDQFNATQRAAFKPKIIARNTFRYNEGGVEIIRLHSTDVVRKPGSGAVILNSGGWRTVTTKDRMNNNLAGYSVYSDRGNWFVRRHADDVRVPYYDNMEIPKAFKNAKRGDAELAKQNKTRKQIKLFCNKLDNLKVLPEPSPGDCWLCCMRDKAGKPIGGNDTGHLLEHVKEGYLHGSLLYNALIDARYGNPAVVWQMENYDRQHGRKLHNGGNVKRALRRYLSRKLGLAV